MKIIRKDLDGSLILTLPDGRIFLVPREVRQLPHGSRRRPPAPQQSPEVTPVEVTITVTLPDGRIFSQFRVIDTTATLAEEHADNVAAFLSDAFSDTAWDCREDGDVPKVEG